VLLFDYRGYGLSTGSPDERGTYLDARAARMAMAGYAADRIFYLGESLGGAVALELALEQPPAGLILQSTFTSVRDVARRHYPVIPAALIPDAYPNKRRISELRAPLLVLHGERDQIVPAAHGRELFELAPEPKRLHVFGGVGHNDLLLAADEYAAVVADWAVTLG
jgi:pimeloyl-ACP methyl ester carboxylesterase